MMKKIICGFLTLIMLVGATITAFAQVSQGYIGYSADRVDENAYEGVEAIDIENINDDTNLITTLKQYDYFYIDSVEGMKWFGEIVSRGTSTEVSEEEPYSFFGKTVFLKNDIDFKGGNMLPIGEDGNREGEPDGAECDAGPIILQKAVEVLENDTPETLQKRIMENAECKILPEAVKLFCDDKITVENGKTIISK